MTKLKKRWSERFFDWYAKTENNTTKFFQMYGFYFLIMFVIYALVVLCGWYTDFKVLYSILYSITDSHQQATTGARIGTTIIHVIFVFAGGIMFKIRVNNLHKEPIHKPIFGLTTFLVSLALIASLTLNFFADSWTNTEVKKQNKVAAEKVDKSTEKAEKQNQELDAEKLAQFKADTTAIGISTRKKIALAEAAADLKQKKFDSDGDSWNLTLKQYELDKIPVLLDEQAEAVQDARRTMNQEIMQKSDKQQTAIFASMGFIQKNIEITEENKDRNAWIIRILSTVLQILGLLISWQVWIMIRNGNKSRTGTAKPNNLQTQAEQLVLQGLTTGKKGRIIPDKNLRASIRNYYKRGNGKPKTDNWQLFLLTEQLLENDLKIFIKKLDTKRIEFQDENKVKI